MEIQEIKSQLTLAQVLQHYSLKPDKNMRLNCPFHEDKTPSLQVYYKTHTAYCFSSNCKTHGKSMDIIDFIMHKENTDKHNALLKCAEIISYFEGKINHKQTPINNVGKNPPLEGREAVFAFDNDEAGNKAAEKYKAELQASLPQVIFTKIILPNKDVNETLQAHSDENIFIDLLNGRTTDFFLSTEKEKEPSAKLFIESDKKEQTITIEKISTLANQQISTLNTSNPYKLSYTTDTGIYYIQGGLPKTTDNLKIMLVIENPLTNFKARNKIDLYEDKQVERLCKEVAEKLSLRKDLLEADLYRLTELLENHIQKELHQNSEEDKPLQVLTIKERTELESFAKKPKLIKRLNELLGQTGIVGEERNRIFLLIIAISHKMPETLHALIQGSSGSGKTRLLKQVSDCMPKENVTKLTRLSDKVLYNFPEHYFINRLLCLEDIDGLSEEAEFAFRELQSNGELNSATSIKLESGQITSAQKTVKGPIASLACTTHGEIYEDNMSRVFLIAVDESMEQTKRIIEYQNKKAAGLIGFFVKISGNQNQNHFRESRSLL